MPDIAELRTKFTADDSDFQTAYRSVSAALILFARAESESANGAGKSATSVRQLGSALRSLTEDYQKLAAASGEAENQWNRELTVMNSMTAQSARSAVAFRNLTEEIKKQTVAAKLATETGERLATIKAPEVSKEATGSWSRFFEGLHKVAEVAKDIKDLKEGLDVVSEGFEKLKDLGEVTSKIKDLADGIRTLTGLGVGNGAFATLLAKWGLTGGAAGGAREAAAAVGEGETIVTAGGAAGVTASGLAIPAAGLFLLANSGGTEEYDRIHKEERDQNALTAEAVARAAAKAVGMQGDIDPATLPNATTGLKGTSKQYADYYVATRLAIPDYARGDFDKEAVQDPDHGTFDAALGISGDINLRNYLAGKRIFEDHYKKINKQDKGKFAPVNPFSAAFAGSVATLGKDSPSWAGSALQGAIGPGGSNLDIDAVNEDLKRLAPKHGSRKPAETDFQKVQEDWPTKRDEAKKAADLAKGPLKVTNEQMKGFQLTTKQLNPELESTGMIYDYLAGHLNNLTKSQAKQLIQLKLLEEAGKQYNKTLQDQQSLLDEIEKKRRETEVMKLPEKDYADRIAMDQYGSAAKDLADPKSKSYDPSKADYVKQMSGFEQQQDDHKAIWEASANAGQALVDELNAWQDAYDDWQDKLDDMAASLGSATVKAKDATAKALAHVAGGEDPRKAFVQSKLDEYNQGDKADKSEFGQNKLRGLYAAQFDAEQQAKFADDYRESMKGLNAELAKYSKQTEDAKLHAIEFDGELQKMGPAQAASVLAMQEQIQKLKDWSDSVKEISKDLAGTVTSIMDKIFVEGSHHLQKNVTQAVNSMIRGMASKFIGDQAQKGFGSLFGLLKPKTASADGGERLNEFRDFAPAKSFVSAIQQQVQKVSGMANNAPIQLNTSALQTNTAALQNLSQSLATGGGGTMGAPGGSGGFPGGLFGGGGFGSGGTGGIGSGVGFVPTGGIGNSLGTPASGGVVSINSDRPHGDASNGTINVHLYSPTTTGDAKRAARAIEKERSRVRAAYA